MSVLNEYLLLMADSTSMFMSLDVSLPTKRETVTSIAPRNLLVA